MPNWVHNQLVLRGPDPRLDEVASCLRGADGAPVSFQSLLPRPADRAEDWYSWNTEHWGTKWDASAAAAQRRPGELEFSFATAWSPPVGFIEALRVEFDDLDWTYRFEEEQGWGGSVEVIQGDVVDYDHYDAPERHADLAARGVVCACAQLDRQMFDDCFSYRAQQAGGLDPESLEAAKVLAVDWAGTFQELLAAARRL